MPSFELIIERVTYVRCEDFSAICWVDFDMDGTVVDTMPCHERAWLKVADKVGYPLSPSVMYELAGAPLRTIAQEMMLRANMPLTQLQEVMKLKRQFGHALIMAEATLLPAAQIVKSYHNQNPWR